MAVIPTINVSLQVVACTSAMVNPRVPHPAHVYSRHIQTVVNDENRMIAYFWCEGWNQI